MEESAPRIVRDPSVQPASLRLEGRWTSAQLGSRRVWRQLVPELRQACGNSELHWDLRSAEQLDHVGAQLLWNVWGRGWPRHVDLAEGQRSMFERVERFSVDIPRERPFSLMRGPEALGRRVIEALAQARALTTMLGQLLLDIGRLIRRPSTGPWRDISGHLYQMGTTALPITALVGFLIGVVLAYLMSIQLRQFGAESFIVNILGISLVRELGPLLAAILVAGRSGSAITAQIGVMRVTEELDAMRVMGIAHGFRLVMPRSLAMAVAMPLIGVWTTLASLAGGMLAADLAMNITPAYFVNALPGAVSLPNLGIAVLKSVVFGVLIALIGCHYGMRVEPNTESLGKGTTASVVTSITVVILVDALFAIVFRNVGF
ncbi:MlaE family lipid ABC transporter permease subunit [Xylophilus rhododendri]|uniref:MlaE family lipid ABC transporter permease subunit n=1 Tax=Xylophilus rhododendri TaxID=2697032 RepID=A0A857JC73_9BURK|nr:ABC transporter permease [Xylophilus rhododendri]QHJ01557.1 MlaE family lipid ABC transporter permease subunit [Xylophilus rhododendri]